MRQMISGLVAAVAMVAASAAPAMACGGLFTWRMFAMPGLQPMRAGLLRGRLWLWCRLRLRVWRRLRASAVADAVLLRQSGPDLTGPATSHRCRPIRKAPSPDGMPTTVPITIPTTAAVTPMPCITTMMARP